MVSAKIRQQVIDELTDNPEQTDIQIAVMFGVAEREVSRIRGEEGIQKKEKPSRRMSAKKTARKNAANKAAKKAEELSIDKLKPEAKFFLQLPDGTVVKLLRRNSSQAIVLVEVEEKDLGRVVRTCSLAMR